MPRSVKYTLLGFGSMAPDAVLFVALRLGPLAYDRDDTHAVVPGV
ncbi:hypothetical protein ACU686_06325 [Yinghuangia aomiensis]